MLAGIGRTALFARAMQSHYTRYHMSRSKPA
jgi:hypothetical protein